VRRSVAIAALLLTSAGAAARAEPPAPPRVIDVPTGRLQPSGHLFATGGLFVVPDRTPMLGAALGVGGLAEVDLEVTDRTAVCLACTSRSQAAESIAMPTAAFKIGLPAGHYAAWQPAVALGLRSQVRSRSIDFGDRVRDLRAARMFLAVSQKLGEVWLHAGADVWDAESATADGAVTLHDRPLSHRVRPFAGLEWNPSIYPRTRLLIDGSWAPVFTPAGPELRWLLGWGVRYQALSWGSIELDVRHREGGGLENTEVTVRLNGAWDLHFPGR